MGLHDEGVWQYRCSRGLEVRRIAQSDARAFGIQRKHYAARALGFA